MARLAVARGAISHEEIGEIEALLTRETIFEVLRWSGGSFDFRTQPVPHRREPETLLRAEQILMDGLRMVDEWQSFADQVPSDDTVFEATGTFESYLNQQTDSGARYVEDVERVFRLIDGRLPNRRVVDLSRLGSFDATRAISLLRAAGVIAPADPSRLRKQLRRPRPRVLPRADARRWVATLLPLAMLAAVVVSIGLGQRMEPRVGAFAIPPAELDLVREDYATMRVQHAVEEFRFASGRWPAHLRELAERGILAPAELASREGQPYYYAVRAEGAVLLAPEH
jgi:hypothetical protein